MPQIREQIAMVHLPPSKTLKYLFHVRKTTKPLKAEAFKGFIYEPFMDSEKAPTVQVGAFADIYSAGSAAGRCYSIRPLSFKSNSTSVPLAFFITTLSSIFSLNESFISVIGFLSIA